MDTKLSYRIGRDEGSFPPPHLTPTQFIAWLESRLSAGESCTQVGRSLGVTHAAIRRWISGASGVSDTVLLLAERMLLEPRELAAGLPTPAVSCPS